MCIKSSQICEEPEIQVQRTRGKHSVQSNAHSDCSPGKSLLMGVLSPRKATTAGWLQLWGNPDTAACSMAPPMAL